MCDVDKYRRLYKEIEKLTPEDTLEIILNTGDEEEQEFFELLGDYLLQKNQREVIKANRF